MTALSVKALLNRFSKEGKSIKKFEKLNLWKSLNTEEGTDAFWFLVFEKLMTSFNIGVWIPVRGLVIRVAGRLMSEQQGSMATINGTINGVRHYEPKVPESNSSPSQ